MAVSTRPRKAPSVEECHIPAWAACGFRARYPRTLCLELLLGGLAALVFART